MDEELKIELNDCRTNIKISKLDAEYHKKQMEYAQFQIEIYESELEELNKLKNE